MAVLVIRGLNVIVDDEDVDLVKSKKWHVLKNHGREDQIYLRHTINFRKEGKKSCYSLHLHRMILKAQRGQLVDHINGNTLDNRKENLRFVTKEQNSRNAKINKRNKTGYKGVSWSRFHNKYRAYISVEGKNISLGMYDNPTDAYEAYCKASQKYHGEYGRVK